MQKALLTASDVAQYLKVNVDTVYLLIRKEGLPAVRIGGQWRFRTADVERWLQARMYQEQEA